MQLGVWVLDCDERRPAVRCPRCSFGLVLLGDSAEAMEGASWATGRPSAFLWCESRALCATGDAQKSVAVASCCDPPPPLACLWESIRSPLVSRLASP